MTADVEFGAIDLPAVTWCHVAKSLGIKLPRQGTHSKFLHRIGDDLRALVIGTQSGLIILMDEKFQRLEHAKNSFLANFAATPDAIFLRAHVQQGITHQLFPADEYPGRLRAADILTTAEGHHIEAEGRIFP